MGSREREGDPVSLANWIQSEERTHGQVDPSRIPPDRRRMLSSQAATCSWTPYFHDAYVPALVEQEMKHKLLDGDVYLFLGRTIEPSR